VGEPRSILWLRFRLGPADEALIMLSGGMDEMTTALARIQARKRVIIHHVASP
jgi:hypothetical protein